MIKNLFGVFILSLLIVAENILFAQSEISFNKYHTNTEVQQILKQIQNENTGKTKLHTIAASPGGEPIIVLEIGSNLNDVPAIFVGANFEGNIPLATEGALRFAKMLLDSSKYTIDKKWYILPSPNPDAAKGYFANIRYNRVVNDFDVNNDVDEASGEDGFEDLNGDGFITKMRVKDLEGKYRISEIDPRLMVLADVKKGERGEYKLYSEGIDNDGDGKYNEDGAGGINPGIAFPHLFPYLKKEAGLWSGQTPEVYGILRFIYDRPEIAMVYTLGSSNFCLIPPKKGRKGEKDPNKIKVPSRYANRFGIDASKTYTMEQLVEIIKMEAPSQTEVTPAMIASMVNLGAAVNPLDDDLKFYKKLSDDYKTYLKSSGFSTENLDPEPAKDGSFELWAYYHLGVPSFSMRLFSVPKVKEEKEKEESEEKTEDNKNDEENENKISEKDKALLAWSDKEWNGKGFLNWKKYEHAELENVEIGGYIPYLESTPKAKRIDSLLSVQLPWLLQLSEKLPEIKFADEKITGLGSDVYKLEIFIENKGYLSYPIAIGQRNNQPAPVVVLLEGNVELLEGISRTPLGNIGGNQVKKLAWMIKADKGTEITLKIESAMFGTELKQIKIGG